MADEMMKEKIYCMPCMDNNNTQLLAELMNAKNQGTDAATMAALFSRDRSNEWMNNPFMYLIWMAWMGNGNFGFGGNGRYSDAELNARFNQLSAQINTNQNTDLLMNAVNGNHEALHSIANTLGVSFAEMQNVIGQVQNAITHVGGQVGLSGERVINAVNLGDMNIINAIKDCCCQNKELVLTQGYQNQLAQKDAMFATQKGFSDLGFGLQKGMTDMGYAMQNGFERAINATERGFSATAYEAQRQTCDIINAGNANTQRIIDTMNQHWGNELAQKYEDAKRELSQANQTQQLIAALKTA